MTAAFKDPKTVIDKDKFDAYCNARGFDGSKVIKSRDFVDYEDDFSSKIMVENDLIDPQFTDYMPEGVVLKKSILPFSFLENSIMVMIYAEPDAEVKTHAHTKGFFRVVHQGELILRCNDLVDGQVSLFPGDWAYVPAGTPYGYKAGTKGYHGGMCYCTNQ